MTELFHSASDDQFALMGCAAALLTSGLLMYLSYFVGPVAREERQQAMQRLVQQRQKLVADNMREIPREKAA